MCSVTWNEAIWCFWKAIRPALSGVLWKTEDPFRAVSLYRENAFSLALACFVLAFVIFTLCVPWKISLFLWFIDQNAFSDVAGASSLNCFENLNQGFQLVWERDWMLVEGFQQKLYVPTKTGALKEGVQSHRHRQGIQVTLTFRFTYELQKWGREAQMHESV